MEGIKKSSSADVAPFVAKTYNMVCEPRTDAIIRWGRANNSFIVLDLSRFSQILLPSYFKHNNFSSFIRQLNTYGFRKVDPDHWEFAHECFLRGQIHLLSLIVRRKKKGCHGDGGGKVDQLEDEEDGGEERLLAELARLRIEQKAIREEMDDMSKRLLATERKPRQMVSFLIKVAQDPELLPRLVLSKKKQRKQQQQQQQQLVAGLDEKTSWLCADNSSSSLPPLPQSLQEFRSGEMTPNELGLGSCGDDTAVSSSDSELSSSIPSTEAPCSQIFILPEFVDDHEVAEECVAYPFSLLGHILF